MAPEFVRGVEQAETEPRASTRRGILSGTGFVGLAGFLAACGGSGKSDGGASGASGSALAKKNDIPVGGGKIFAAEKVVVTQPTAGQFKAFSSTCTHMGCTVAAVSGGTINCPCHGSKYKISDASVVSGPAPQPLPAKQITVTGDAIKLA